MKGLFITLNILCTYFVGISQEKNHTPFHAAYKSYQSVDSSRIYKPNSAETNRLHYRPVQADIWYPSEKESTEILRFGELLGAYEHAAPRFQDDDYTGYYAQKEGEKHYIRFVNSKHEDFSCLPTLLNTSTKANELYTELMPVISSYFDHYLKSARPIDLVKQFAGRADVSTEPLTIIPDTATSVLTCILLLKQT